MVAELRKMKFIISTTLTVILVLLSTATSDQIIEANFCVDHGFATGLFPHPDPQKCSSFVLCAMFIPIPQVCPTGKIFVADLSSNPPYGACQLGDADICTLLTTTTSTLITTISTETTTELECSTQTTENATSSTKDPKIPTYKFTSSLPTTTPIPIHRCPPGGFGYIPHYLNCSRYFKCIGGIRHLRFCPYGLLFDSVTLKCTYPDLAVCASQH